MKESRTRSYELTIEDITNAVKDYIKKHKRVEVNGVSFECLKASLPDEEERLILNGCTCTYTEPAKEV